MNKMHTTTDGNENEAKYQTRYGIMGAVEAAEVLLDRSVARLSFLTAVLAGCVKDGYDFKLSGQDVNGLAHILEDVAYDVSQSRWFYYGEYRGESWTPEPGRVGEEVKS